MRGVLELQEKNYTNPEDRGRFGFSRSGDYHTPFKAEGFLVALLIGAAVVAGMALLFAIGKINAQSQMEQESSSTFVFVGSAIALVAFVAILILIFGVGVRSVKKGFRCTYSVHGYRLGQYREAGAQLCHPKKRTRQSGQGISGYAQKTGPDSCAGGRNPISVDAHAGE